MSFYPKKHNEIHRSNRIGWLRAAILASNDAIVSTASLMVGVAASNASKDFILTAGLAGLVAGSLSMAVGEYVSISSQRDAEQADIEKEKEELLTTPELELNELATIYIKRGLTKELAFEVAEQLTAKDALASHLRDELGINPEDLANPLKAAWISAVCFALFALLPVIFLLLASEDYRIHILISSSLVSLGCLGSFGAFLGGAPILRASGRVLLGGILAMGLSFWIGKIFEITMG